MGEGRIWKRIEYEVLVRGKEYKIKKKRMEWIWWIWSCTGNKRLLHKIIRRRDERQWDSKEENGKSYSDESGKAGILFKEMSRGKKSEINKKNRVRGRGI